MAVESNGAGSRSVPWWRFSLKQLLLATALVAVACVALRSANASWAAATFGLAWLALVASLLLALYRDGGRKAFWVGFAVVGWLYFILPLFSWYAPLARDALITTRLSHWAYDWIYAEPSMAAGSPGGGMLGGMSMPGGSGMYPGGAGGYTGPMGGGDGSMTAGYGSIGGPGGMPGAMEMGGMMGSAAGGSAAVFTGPSQDDFTSVAHTLWMLMLALCGGWFAQWLYATRERQSSAAGST